MTPFDLELALDRLEAELAPELAAHAAAHHARALVDPHPPAPPWPAALLDGRAARLARVATIDPVLRARARTLGRWATAAALDGDAGWRAARAADRDPAGLAVRHRAFAAAAARLGHAGPRALADAIHGPAPTEPVRLGTAPAREGGATTSLATWPALLAHLARTHGLDPAGLDVRDGRAALTFVVAPGQARCVIGPGRDPLDALLVAAHELGHGLYAAQQGGLPLGLAAPPARWFDEAMAAWAVRAVEEDAELSEEAAARRLARAALTVRLAAFEAELLDGAGVDAAAARHVPGLRLAEVPALFDEPGVMASYHAAAQATVAPAAGELRAWARAGAALYDGAP